MSDATVFSWDALPTVRGELTPSGGAIRVHDEDFRVTEIPAYLPSGKGSHFYLRVRKVGHTTRDLVSALQAAGVPDRRIGVAGLKDKRAVTEQWLSVPWASADAAATAFDALENVEILETSRHRNKLGVGHLHGNRFEVRIRHAGPEAAERAGAIVDALVRDGMPNWFGPQRFGRYGRNAVDGLRILAGERVPGDRRLQRFFLSAVQSLVFNRLLADRIRDGSYGTVLAGDWATKHDTGGVFRIDDAEAERPRAARFEISALLPLHGRKVRISAGEPGRREEEVLRSFGIAWTDLTGRRGDRRATRVRVHDPQVAARADGCLLAFTLPKGAYATSLLREVTGVPVDAPVPSPLHDAPEPETQREPTDDDPGDGD